MTMRRSEQEIDREKEVVARRDVADASVRTDTAYGANGAPIRTSTVTQETSPSGYQEAVTTDVRQGYFDSAMSRIMAALFAVFAVVEGLIGLRFVLLAFGANRTSSFVDFIYDVSWPFVRPFSSAFNDRTWDQGIIEISSLLAMGVILLVYLLANYVVAALVPRHDTTSATTRRERLTHV